jgi:hypothetical protein
MLVVVLMKLDMVVLDVPSPLVSDVGLELQSLGRAWANIIGNDDASTQ